MEDEKEIFIAGNKVLYEKSAEHGVFYLENDLDNKEADVYFYYARNRKPAPFEDDRDRQYQLTYKGSDTYELKRI